MKVLTTSGYKNIQDCSIGEQLIAYDVYDGHEIINELLGKEWMSPDSFQDIYEDTIDESGNTISVLVKTKEELYIEIYGDIKFYNINNTWILYGNQSIWANLNVVHVKNLQIGDTIYNGTDADVTITSIEQVTGIGWWRLSVSGDHSFIADDLTLHNASRYWVGGGSSSAWNATTNTNWGSASGGANNASVPTSADDVTFDGAGANGNTPSLISSSFTILSLNITLGYTSTMTHNTNLTIAGNITLTTGYTIAGASSLIITANSTINTNGKIWPNSFSITSNSTITLTSDLNISGTLNNSANNTTINRTTSQILTTGNGVSITNGSIAGSSPIYITGGTWSSTTVANPLSSSNGVFINGNVTLGTFASLQGTTLTLVSGTLTTTGSTLGLLGAITFNSSLSGTTWNNITTNNNVVSMTLNHNLNLNGTLSITVGTTINKTTSEVINCVGLSTTLGINISGTADIYLTGGTWEADSAAYVANNLFLNGNITLGSSVNPFSNIGGGTLTYLSGTISLIAAHQTRVLGSSSLDTFGMSFNNFTIGLAGITVTLISDLTINGLYTQATTGAFSTSNGSKVVIYGGIFMIAGMTLGTADIYLRGGTWTSVANSYVTNNLFLDGFITLSSSIYYSTSTMTYNSGIINSTGTILTINASCTIINFGSIPLRQVLITAGQTITMNEFFTGNSSQICQVYSTITNINYTITFLDGFEKIAKHVAVLNATITNRMQLLIITKYKSNFNRGTNIGVRYINQLPNGFAKNENFVTGSKNHAPMFKLVGDPNFVKQA